MVLAIIFIAMTELGMSSFTLFLKLMVPSPAIWLWHPFTPHLTCSKSNVTASFQRTAFYTYILRIYRACIKRIISFGLLFSILLLFISGITLTSSSSFNLLIFNLNPVRSSSHHLQSELLQQNKSWSFMTPWYFFFFFS